MDARSALVQRQQDGDDRPIALFAFNAQFAAVHLDDFVADGQTDAAARFVGVAFIEFLLDARQIGCRDARPVVCNDDGGPLAAAFDFDV